MVARRVWRWQPAGHCIAAPTRLAGPAGPTAVEQSGYFRSPAEAFFCRILLLNGPMSDGGCSPGGDGEGPAGPASWPRPSSLSYAPPPPPIPHRLLIFCLIAVQIYRAKFRPHET